MCQPWLAQMMNLANGYGGNEAEAEPWHCTNTTETDVSSCCFPADVQILISPKPFSTASLQWPIRASHRRVPGQHCTVQSARCAVHDACSTFGVTTIPRTWSIHVYTLDSRTGSHAAPQCILLSSMVCTPRCMTACCNKSSSTVLLCWLDAWDDRV